MERLSYDDKVVRAFVRDDRLVAIPARDKKRRGGASNFVLLQSSGDVVTECDVSVRELSDVIEEVRER